jgi:hypothetical protein
MRFEKMYAKVSKFHGKPKKIEVEDDEGNKQEFNIYPMPMRFLPDTLAIQKIASNAPKKESGEPDLEALSVEEKAELQKLNMETAKATLAFSMLIDAEGYDYQKAATIPEADFEEAKTVVSTMTTNGMQKILLAMSEVNNVNLTGDNQKNGEVSH